VDTKEGVDRVIGVRPDDDGITAFAQWRA